MSDQGQPQQPLAAQAKFWQIAYLNERLSSSNQSLIYAERTRALVRAQYAAGAVSTLELRQADQAVANQLAAQTTLEQQRVEARNALAIVFDTPPESALLSELLPTEPATLFALDVPQPKPGLPAAMLARRPDLRAAEARLRRTLAEGDSTRASYYPTLILTGTAGTSAPDLVRLLANPVATLGAGVTLPFLRLNDYRLDSALARELYAQAVIAFRQALYGALAEVETALSAGRQLASQADQLAAQLTSAREVERLYAVRYRAGATTLQILLDAQERRRGAEIALLANRLDRLNAQVTLYKALGRSGPL